MIRHIAAAAGLAIMLSPWVAQAAEKTAVLNVHNAYCELCPAIVTKALQNVSGIKLVKVTNPDAAGDMTATVTFDDAVAGVAKLVDATTKAGYPSEAVGKGG
jgi:periplasmic mercuric ion binding protein